MWHKVALALGISVQFSTQQLDDVRGTPNAAASCFKARTAWPAIEQFNVSIYSRVFLQKLCTCNTLQPARTHTSKLTLPALHSYLLTYTRRPSPLAK